MSTKNICKTPIPTMDNFIREWVANTLSIPIDQLKAEDDLLELGLDSIQLFGLIDECQKYNIKLEFPELFIDTKLAAWEKYWQKILTNSTETHPKIVSNSSVHYRPGETFALTPLQQAYWQGRQKEQVLGGVACQVYLELEYPTIADDLLHNAVDKLFKRHAMLRMRINKENQGIILDSVAVSVPQYHWEQLTETQSKQERILLRERLSHYVTDFHTENGFKIAASHDKVGTCLHINIDMIVADAMSILILLEDLNHYLFKNKELPELSYEFPQYWLEQQEKNIDQIANSKNYWRERLQEGLPLAPELPLSCQPYNIKRPVFFHREWQLNIKLWQKLKAIARHHGLTPSILLAGCLAETLRGWSEKKTFSLNLTLFNRRGEHPDLNKIVADFTSMLILKCETSKKNHLIDNFLLINKQFMQDVEHSHYSAVEVLRDWSQQCGEQVILPIVFTSNLGGKISGEKVPGKLSYVVSQTPQVWLDCQIMESEGNLIVSWDTVDELFPSGMLTQMFNFLQKLILSIAKEEQPLNQPITGYVPQHIIQQRRNPNNQAPVPFKANVLHQGFWTQVKQCPNRIAIIDAYRSLTYQALAKEVSGLSSLLRRHPHFKRSVHVGIYLPKSADQAIAALAVLSTGGVYVPLDTHQTNDRLNQLIQQANINLIIANQDLHLDCPVINLQKNYEEKITQKLSFDYSNPEDTAYLIFTSGSTGIPKAVEISHQAAMNTIDDINRRYADAKNMRLFSVSAFNFDLSVYDLFGPLSIGGTVIYPHQEDEKNALQWLELSHRYQVTHWNSVPAIFEMLLVVAEYDKRHLPSSLQQVFLSGDWIKLDLFNRLRQLGNHANFVALGGATEASIWSNAFEVSNIEPTWRSIPYGYPLANQYYRVVDEQYRDCPDWVTGELYIGGKGLAKGYYNDIQKTAAQFITLDNERFYRTGDYGRFWPGGCLEFLGRKDRQIKLNGYRIELGEIEYAAESIEEVKKAVVIYTEQPSKKLHLFVESHKAKLITPPQNAASCSEIHIPLPDAPQEEEAITVFLLSQLITEHLHLTWEGLLSAQELRKKARITDEYALLFLTWLNFLVQHGKLHSNKDQYCLISTPCSEPNIASPHLSSLLSALKHNLPWIAEVVTGQKDKWLLIDHPSLSPESLIASTPSTQKVVELVIEKFNHLSTLLERPINVLEFGGRSGLIASQILNKIPPESINYCLQESASSISHQAITRLNGYNHHVEVINALEDAPFKIDILLANNALHRCHDIEQMILKLQTLCHGDTTLLLYENYNLNPLAMLTVLLLREPNGYSDFRGQSLSPLLSVEQWNALLPKYGFMPKEKVLLGAYALLLSCQASNVQAVLSQEDIKQNLKRQLPDYMLPATITLLDKLPLTANGKINHKALQQMICTKEDLQVNNATDLIMTEKQSKIANLWEQVLKVKIDAESNFFLCGGDSLHATRLIELLKQAGVKEVKLSTLFTLPVLKNFAAAIDFADNTVAANQIVHNSADRFLPFPVTEVQQSYLIGRQLNFYLGGVSTYFYQEFEGAPFEIQKLETALNTLIKRHDALRLVFDEEEGQQRVLPTAQGTALEVIHCQEKDWSFETEKQRERLSHYKVDPTKWPLFKATLIQSDAGNNRFCLGLDNLIVDGLSMRIFLKELAALYQDAEAKLPSLEISFRDYLLAQKSYSNHQAHAYWSNRIKSLPEAPLLPLAIDPLTMARPYFERQQEKLSQQEWQKLKDKAQYYQITPSCLLLTCYAQVLAHWSEHSSLTINVTLFDRNPVHPDINHILGDFTSLLLLECHQNKGEYWYEKAKRLQKQLWQDLEYIGVSAVWVIREFNRQRQRNDIRMPVVFTSALGVGTDSYPETDFPQTIWGISQTPQIWLDHQVFELNGELLFNWDSVKGLFPDGMINDMFNAYCQLLKQLVTAESWQQVIEVSSPKTQQLVDNHIHQKIISPEITQRNGAIPVDCLSIEKNTPAVQEQVKLLCEQLQLLLNTDKVCPQDNFFAIGGDSIIATRLVAILKRHHGLELPLWVIFKEQTIENIAPLITKQHQLEHISFEEGLL